LCSGGVLCHWDARVGRGASGSSAPLYFWYARTHVGTRFHFLCAHARGDPIRWGPWQRRGRRGRFQRVGPSADNARLRVRAPVRLCTATVQHGSGRQHIEGADHHYSLCKSSMDNMLLGSPLFSELVGLMPSYVCWRSPSLFSLCFFKGAHPSFPVFVHRISPYPQR